MKRLFILGGSILQLPAVKKAKELGYYVAVADQNPAAPARKYTDDFFLVSTTDVEGIMQAALEFRPDGIMTVATDTPMRAIAHVASTLQLPGIDRETAIRATNKWEMRKALQNSQVPIPWFYLIRTKEEWENRKKDLRMPCILKPTDNSGSRGVVLIESEAGLDSAYEYSMSYSPYGSLIVEEYMEGPEVSVETISVDGTVHVLAVTDKVTTGPPYFVETGHSQPSQVPEMKIEEIKDIARKAVLAIGIHNGPAHVEIKLTDEGAKLVELGARMGGDNITTHLVPLSTGIDFLEAVIHLSCGEEVDLRPKWQKGSAIRYISSLPGKLKSVQGLDQTLSIEGIEVATLTKEIGDLITEVHNSTERAGFIISQGNTAKEAISRCEAALSLIYLEAEAVECELKKEEMPFAERHEKSQNIR